MGEGPGGGIGQNAASCMVVCFELGAKKLLLPNTPSLLPIAERRSQDLSTNAPEAVRYVWILLRTGDADLFRVLH